MGDSWCWVRERERERERKVVLGQEMLQVNKRRDSHGIDIGSRRERSQGLAGVMVDTRVRRWALALKIPVEDKLKIVEVVVLCAG
jgi:hypothetical protein